MPPRSVNALAARVYENHRREMQAAENLRLLWEQIIRLSVLSETMVSEIDNKVNPDTVIKLDRNGTIIVPAFQFTNDGQLIDVVASLNQSFHAWTGRLTTIHWWLTPCFMLGCKPINAIGHVDASRLEASARAYRAHVAH